jgi:cobalt-zinc-cadmium efflux system membrane fusion protein
MIASLLAPCGLSPALGEELRLAQSQIERLDIGLNSLQPSVSEPVAVLPATIVPPVNGRIAIPAPFAGTVVHVDALPGRAVVQGEPLVTITSRDVVETLVRLKQAEADLQAAKVIAQRQRALADKDLVTANRADEAAAQAERIDALVVESRRLLAVGNIRLNPDRTYTLTSPKDGRIVENRASPGAALQAMDAAIVIDTSRDLWVQAQVPANLVGAIRVGDEVRTAEGATGHVVSVGISVDPLTRSTTLLADLPGAAGPIPGQMTKITVTRTSPSTALEVPSTAVTWIDGSPRVFLRTDIGFSVMTVKLRGQTRHLVTLEGDLRPGQQVATVGLAQLEKMLRGQ